MHTLNVARTRPYADHLLSNPDGACSESARELGAHEGPPHAEASSKARADRADRERERGRDNLHVTKAARPDVREERRVAHGFKCRVGSGLTGDRTKVDRS